MDDTAAASVEPTRSIDPAATERQAMYFLLNSVVVPRPIAWVATRAEDGTVNLAPHSYFTIASVAPPVVAFVSIGDKDTLRNVRSGGEFTVSVVDHDTADRMNVTAADAPPHVSEVELAGLSEAPSELVSVPRVAEAPVAMECRLDRIVEVGDGRMVLGEVLRLHLAERVIDERDRVAPELLDAVGRMGGADYATTRDRFQMKRPRYADLAGD